MHFVRVREIGIICICIFEVVVKRFEVAAALPECRWSRLCPLDEAVWFILFISNKLRGAYSLYCVVLVVQVYGGTNCRCCWHTARRLLCTCCRPGSRGSAFLPSSGGLRGKRSLSVVLGQIRLLRVRSTKKPKARGCTQVSNVKMSRSGRLQTFHAFFPCPMRSAMQDLA